MQKFSKKEALEFGWNITKNNFPLFLALIASAFIIQFVPSFITELLKKNHKILWVIFGIFSWILQLIVSMGLIKISLRFVSGEKGELRDLLGNYALLWKYLAGSVLYGLISMAGFLLLIVPGIIWSIQYQFVGYLILDQGLGPIKALKKSSEMTKGSKWNLFVFSLLMMLVVMLGFLCLIAGIFAAIPTVMIAGAFVYRKLLSQVGTEIKTA